jgi:hypothetical protein
MMRLGLPIPPTWLIPPKSYEEKPDLQVTLERYAKHFDLGALGKDLGYPCFMKPFDGGGWVGVNKIDDENALRDAYEKSGRFVMHLQAGVHPFESFVRCVGIGPQLRTIRYEPTNPLHERYLPDEDFLSEDDAALLHDLTLTINAFFGWDFNSGIPSAPDGRWPRSRNTWSAAATGWSFCSPRRSTGPTWTRATSRATCPGSARTVVNTRTGPSGPPWPSRPSGTVTRPPSCSRFSTRSTTWRRARACIATRPSPTSWPPTCMQSLPT